MIRHLAIPLLAMSASPLMAASIEIGSGPIWVQPDVGPGVSRFTITRVALDSFITWTSGENQTDGVVHALQTYGPEPKFNYKPFPGGFDLAARVFTGFTDKDGPGPRGSTTETSGSGQSEVRFTPEGTFAVAKYKVTATGTLGNVPDSGTVPVVADYIARADGHDPMIVKGAQLEEAGLAAGGADLFFSFALYALDLASALPAFGQYSSAAAAWSMVANGVTTTALSVFFNAAGDLVLSSAPGVALYLLDAPDSPPPSDTSTALDLETIEALLRADIDPDGRLDAPLHFGALIEGAFDFDDSDPAQEVFRVTADGAVTEPAMKIGYVPAPPAALLLLTALAAPAVLGATRRRR
jgi:hypothetical protein